MTSKKHVYILTLMVLVGVLIAYFYQFHNGLSQSPSDWGNFADYICGLLTPLLALLNIIVFIDLTKSIENNRLTIERAKELRAIIEAAILELNQDDATALGNIELYAMWQSGKAYTVGERIQYGDKLYKCVQAHTSQDDWTPDVAVSLWAVVLIPDPEVIPDWVQPDSTNAYMRGDKVRYNGVIYRSLIDNNVWSPDAYPAGWEIVE